MSTKFKRFLQLSARHKRRRLSALQTHPRNCESVAHDSDDSNSTSSDASGNEPVEILAQHPDPSVSNNNIQNDDVSTDGNEDISVRGEEVEDSEGTSAENEEEVGRGADNDMSNSSGDGNDNIQNHDELKNTTLANAFLTANLNHKQGNILLKTLREFPFNLRCLPNDTRTLLQTPTVNATRHIKQIGGGEYLHLGLKCTLKKKLESLPEDMVPQTIEIDFSTDGAQIHNNGTAQFWPIQYRMYNCPDKRPVIAGVFKGTGKPSNTFEFFEQFVQEIIDIREEGGVLINDRRLPLTIRCFIADAPARAFALNHYGHMSSNACSKCKVEGRRSEEIFFRGTMIFPGINHLLRTDQEYRDMVDEDHHKGQSPLEPVIGLVTQVPFEPLHLIYIGIVKKVLHTHVYGKYGRQKLNKRKLDILDSRMTQLQVFCPTEFNRRPNKFSMLQHFKGTEFRQILLYTAPAILQNVVHTDYYKHFIMLHCVMRLLSFENVSDEMYIYCQAALESYVKMCEELYGEQFISYNVHGLLHTVDDVRRLGPLESYSAFCYENNMPQFRKYIRKPHLALQQFYMRICELSDFVLPPIDNTIKIRGSKIHAEGPLVHHMPARHCRQFRKLQVGNITFSTSLRDNCCILNNTEICIIKNIVQIEGNTCFIVKKFRKQVHVYDVGVTSDLAGVFQCSNLCATLEAINLNDVNGKMYRMPKWSAKEGEEERIVENEWICVILITPLILP